MQKCQFMQRHRQCERRSETSGWPTSKTPEVVQVQAQPLCSLGLRVPSPSKGLILPSWVACEDEGWFLAGHLGPHLSEPGGAVAAVVTRYIA